MLQLGVVVFFALYVCWFMYQACVNLWSHWKDLPTLTKALALPGAGIFLLVDVVFLNFIIGTILFLKLPNFIEDKEWTFTRRITHYKNFFDWRASIAKWICGKLLDPCQTGGHCK